MFLISANLIQLFDAEGLPRGWVRWAWLDVSGRIIVCIMIAMPVPQLRLISTLTTSDEFFVCSLKENKLWSLARLLVNKEFYHAACVHILRASAFDRDLMSPSVEQISELFTRLQKNSIVSPSIDLEHNELTWFWDAHVSKFAKPCFLSGAASTVDENQAWMETTVLAESAYGSGNGSSYEEDESWKKSLHDWKHLTTIDWSPETATPNVLFTCFQGHQITNEFFSAYVERANECLKALITDNLHLTTTNWLPCLMCPHSDCSQQLTPTFVLKRAVTLNQRTPPVAETMQLLRFLKNKWQL